MVPGSHGIVNDVEQAMEIVDKIGFPILIKAVHGGGGKGIQLVESQENFLELFQRVSVEARAAFGSGDVYLGTVRTKIASHRSTGTQGSAREYESYWDYETVVSNGIDKKCLKSLVPQCFPLN